MTSSLLLHSAYHCPRSFVHSAISSSSISSSFFQRCEKLRHLSSKKGSPPSGSFFSKKQQVVPSSPGTAKKINPSTLFSKGPSSSSEDASATDASSSSPPPFTHKQKFVKTQLLAGEWDPSHRDPLFRPPWKSKAKIISAEDFAARPTVSFEEEFSTLADGMIVLSWLTESQRQAIYQMYLDTMVQMGADTDANHITSHEYVVRVIGQKFNISYDRVAAIVQLAHNEEQIKKEGKQVLHIKAQEYVDAKIREHIQNIYQVYGEIDPKEFVEDPLGSTPAYLEKAYHSNGAQTNPKDTMVVDDLYDVDELTQQAILREKDEAQSILDSKVYLEDLDDDTVELRVNYECRNLLKVRHESLQLVLDEYRKTEKEISPVPLVVNKPSTLVDTDESNEGKNNKQQRPRWKYVAHITNEYEDKKKQAAACGKKNNYKKKKILGRKDNTLVEHNGSLRVATLKELSTTSWAPSKNYTEKIYENVKAAWLERQKNGTVGVWGRTVQ